MKKPIWCNECMKVIREDYFCDTCGKDLIKTFLGVPIEVSFGYGHDLDENIYHFCNNECLRNFVDAELKKE